jgi:hypothetical protein
MPFRWKKEEGGFPSSRQLAESSVQGRQARHKQTYFGLYDFLRFWWQIID